MTNNDKFQQGILSLARKLNSFNLSGIYSNYFDLKKKNKF